MTRYTINIGDDFPLGEESPPPNGAGPEMEKGRRRWRGGMLVRVLFIVALIAIVVHHPVPVALVTGLVLLARRRRWAHDSGWFDEMRARWQSNWQANMGRCNRGSRPSWRRDDNRPPSDKPGGGGYGAFV